MLFSFNKIILCIFLLNFFNNGFAQIPDTIQKLEQKLSLETNDVQRISLMNSLAQLWYKQDFNKSLNYAEKSIALIGDKEMPEQNLNVHLTYGDVLMKLNRPSEALMAYQTAVSLSEKLNEQKLKAQCYQKLGNYFVQTNQLDQGIQNYNKALDIRLGQGDKKSAASLYNNLAAAYNMKGDYDHAIENVNQSIKIRDELGDRKESALSLSRLGSIYLSKGEFGLAISQFQKAIPIFKEFNDRPNLISAYHNMVYAKIEKGDFKNVLPIIEEYRNTAEELKDKNSIGNAKLQTCAYYYYTGDNAKAVQNALEVKAYLEKNGSELNKPLNESINQQLFLIHCRMGDPEAQKLFDEQISKKPDEKMLAEIYLAYALWAERTKNKTLQLEMAKKAFDLKDKAAAVTQAMCTAQLGIAYERNSAAKLAEPLIESGIKELRKFESNLLITDMLNALSTLKLKMGKTKKQEALQIALKALQNAERIGNKPEIQRCHKQLSVCYDSLQNHKLALVHLQISDSLENNMLSLGTQREIAKEELQFEHESELQKKETLIQNQNQAFESKQASFKFWYWFLAASLLATILISLIVFWLNRTKYNSEINLKAKEVANAEWNAICEKQRISKDLHDDIGSILSSISILSYSQMQKVNSQLEKEGLKDIGEKAREAMQSMADIVWAIQPENESLDKMIHRFTHFASETCEAANIDFEIIKSNNLDLIKLDMEQRKDLYLILKEITNNILKHAQATKVYCQIDYHEPELKIDIRDNGIGFDTDNGFASQGNGLKNILSRAQKSKIKMECHSSRGKACKYILLVNVDEKPVA